MKTHNYNGIGFWSFESVLNRYNSYVQLYKVSSPSEIMPNIEIEGETQWIYPIMNKVIECIEKKDLACIEIGVEFIESSRSFTFGKILKYNTARALRRASDLLTAEQKERIRKRVADMLRTGYMPREFRQYAKLARKIGLGENWQSKIEQEADFNNPWVKHYYKIIMNNSID